MMHLLADTLRNSVLITGIVTVMMMLIESLNIETRGSFFTALKRNRFGQILFSALLGLIPGCIGGFAAVSLYAGRMISFGALIAMMIASCGDEAFMMIAMDPEKSLVIFAWLLLIAVCAGILVDFTFTRLKIRDFRDSAHGRMTVSHRCCHHHGHEDDGALAAGAGGPVKEDGCSDGDKGGKKRKPTFHRAAMFAGVVIFIAALTSGILEHDHAGVPETPAGNFDFLSETWMLYLFAGLSVIVSGFILLASDHFIDEHLWKDVVRRHLPVIFCWTFGILLIVEFGLGYVDLNRWISDNTALMILLAAAIGIIPESGPHLIFVTLYAGGIVPLPVLLASCISQDGHSSLPLLAESKKSFAAAKLINFGIALAVGYGSLLFF